MTNSLIESRENFLRHHPEKKIEVNGRSWGTIAVGDSGPALVLLPGTLGRADIFWKQIDALKSRTRVLALSYPDCGSIEEWAKDICALMDLHGIETATVLGSSLGGYIAQFMAGSCAGRLENLVAANTLHSVAILSNIPPYNTDIIKIPIEELRQGFVSGMQQWQVEQPERSDLVELLLQEVSGRIPEGELRMRLNALKTGPELPPLALPKTKVFTIESGDDRLIPPPVRDAVRARLSPVRSFHFEHGSHFPYVTYPEEYTAMLERVLGLLGPDQRAV